MRRAIHHGTATRRETPIAPAADSRRGRLAPVVDLDDNPAPVEILLSAGGTFAKTGDTSSEATAERNRQLAVAIMQRIETRLSGRVRNLTVRIKAGTVTLEGQCATYYTKQLAQHAALGILEDEHLENAIVVTIGR